MKFYNVKKGGRDASYGYFRTNMNRNKKGKLTDIILFLFAAYMAFTVDWSNVLPHQRVLLMTFAMCIILKISNTLKQKEKMIAAKQKQELISNSDDSSLGSNVVSEGSATSADSVISEDVATSADSIISEDAATSENSVISENIAIEDNNDKKEDTNNVNPS